MNFRKGNFYKCVADSGFPIIILSIGEFEDEVSFIYGLVENLKDYKNTLFAGTKYYNKNADLMNSSSWLHENYNGVKFNSILLRKEMIQDNFKYLGYENIDKFFPMNGSRPVKDLKELIEIVDSVATRFPDKDVYSEWGYYYGTYSIFINYKDCKFNGYV